MSEKRRHFSPEEKVGILKKHLLEKVPVPPCVIRTAFTPPCFIAAEEFF